MVGTVIKYRESVKAVVVLVRVIGMRVCILSKKNI